MLRILDIELKFSTLWLYVTRWLKFDWKLFTYAGTTKPLGTKGNYLKGISCTTADDCRDNVFCDCKLNICFFHGKKHPFNFNSNSHKMSKNIHLEDNKEIKEVPQNN